MPLKIIKADITQVSCDVIVSSTTTNLQPCGQIDSAIHKAAGPNLAEECKKNKSCEVGKCVITKGYNLPCKYVIHTVAPYANTVDSPHLLANCYKSAVKLAIDTGCSSIAFPLIGAGAKGFSIEKAVSVAVNRFEVDLKAIGQDFLIILVLFDDASKQVADKTATRIINSSFMADDSPIENTAENRIMSENKWISLCRVNRPDKKNDIWMQRLADAVDGMLVAPEFDESAEKIFANRPLIFNQDGPNTPDRIGFWEWSEVAKDDGSGKWLSDAYYIEDVTPVELITVNDTSSCSDIVERLVCGVTVPSYISNRIMFVTPPINSHYFGVLCSMEQLNSQKDSEMNVTLRKDVAKLPCYLLTEDDIFTWKYRRIYKSISLKEPDHYAYVRKINEVIKQLILQRMSWPIFKAQKISKGDWHKFKDFLEEIPTESICEEIAAVFDISTNDAMDCLTAFIDSVESYIDVTDVDADTFQKILENHTGVREQCETIAADQWRRSHEEEIDAANKEVDHIRQLAAIEIQEKEQKLKALDQEKEKVFEEKAKILSEIEAAQGTLAELHKKISQEEDLGKNAVQAIRAKIGEAQKDMAGFIAELSVFMPRAEEPAGKPQVSHESNCWQFCKGSSYDEEDLYAEYIEECTSYQDTIDTLTGNLRLAGVSDALAGYLSAYLYAAYINKAPLLLAGPNAKEIANAASTAITGRSIAVIRCYGEKGCGALLDAAGAKDTVIAVENPFHPDWMSCMADLNNQFDNSEKWILWLHPFAEDLVIEPRGLSNYVLPVFTECFVERQASPQTMVACVRTNGYEECNLRQRVPFQGKYLKKIGLSKYTVNRIQKVIGDAKQIFGTTNADMEYLFAVIPFSVMNNKLNILEDVMENEKGISSAITNEIQRYIEEV